MTIELGDFFRKTLTLSDRSKITLAEELQLCEHYLAIEKIRFGQKLQVNIERDADCLSAKVIPMLLQSLIENAIKHGINHLTETGIIALKCFVRTPWLHITMANPMDGSSTNSLNPVEHPTSNPLKGQSEQAIYQARQTQSRPLVEQFKEWLDSSANSVLPKSAIGKAVQYCLNQWHKLERYLESGLLSIDNNRAERAAKSFVIGRKNWLFSNTARGARASAGLYSLVETAKVNSDWIQQNIFSIFLMNCIDVKPMLRWIL